MNENETDLLVQDGTDHVSVKNRRSNARSSSSDDLTMILHGGAHQNKTVVTPPIHGITTMHTGSLYPSMRRRLLSTVFQLVPFR
jgi:hypothetical protein